MDREVVLNLLLRAEVEELVGSGEDGELAGLVERSLGVLSGLRRERTGRLMAELLVRMLRRRDDRLSSLGSVLARLTHCLSSLTHLGLAVSLLTKDIAQTNSGGDRRISGPFCRQQSVTGQPRTWAWWSRR